MKKYSNILILLLITFSSAYCQWEKVGNVEKLSGKNSGFFDYVISEDCKFIYTLDSNSVLEKWDYYSGNNIWSKTITNYSNVKPKIDYLRISADGKTYCITGLFSLIIAYPLAKIHVDIYDIETGNFIDSASIPMKFYLKTYYDNPSFHYYYCDYISSDKTLFNIIHYSLYHTGMGYKTEDSGFFNISSRSDTGWVSKLNIIGRDSLVCKNIKSNILYFQHKYHYYEYLDVGTHGSHTWKSIENGNTVFNLEKESSANVANFYNYQSYGNFQYENYDTLSGKIYPFNSAFFDNNDKNLYLAIKDTIFTYNLGTNKLELTQILNRYSASVDLMIYNSADNNYFYAVTGNNINIHNIKNLKYNTTFVANVVKSIKNFKNSTDGEYVFFKDESGQLYRINNQALLGSVSVEEQYPVPDNFLISPNPASDFIEITKPTEGWEPSEGFLNAVKIFNVFGETVLKSSEFLTNSQFTIFNSQLRIDVSGLPSGVYFVRMGDRVGKFMKL